ncbi:MAG: hypothetical protein N2554_05285 [Fimbriimonadales bacterium]|nr:hypothetical protein [Fimbriimonadales bacterium]
MRLREIAGCLIGVALVLLAAVAWLIFIVLPLQEVLGLPEWVTLILVVIPASASAQIVIMRALERSQARMEAEGQIPIPTLAQQQLAVQLQYRLSAWTLATAILCGLLAYFIIPRIQYAMYMNPAIDHFFIPVDSLACTIPAGLLGAVVSSFALERRLRQVAGEDWLVVRTLLYAPLSYRIARTIGGFTLILSAVLTLLCIDCYTRVTHEGFFFNRFWSLRERFYSHDDVVDIGAIIRFKHAQTGNIKYKDDPYFMVRFRDGYEFSTVHTAHRYDPVSHQLVRWLSQRTKVPLREATLGVDW